MRHRLPIILALLLAFVGLAPVASAQNLGGITTAPIWQLQGDAITGQADGASIPSWTATVGPTPSNGGTSSYSPVYHATSGPNSKPYVSFAPSQLLYTSALTHAVGKYDIFQVVRLPNTTGNHWTFDTQTGRLVTFTDNNSGSGYGFYDGSFHLQGSFPVASWHILEYRLDDAGASILIDGNVAATTGYTQTALGGMTAIGNSIDLVAGNATATDGGGDMASFVLYAGTLGSSDQNAVGSTLATKYAITSAYVAPANAPSFYPNDAGILYSPYNWYVSSTVGETINSGAYFRTYINATTTCKIGLNVGVAVPYSQTYARIDGGPWQKYVPTAPGLQTWTLTMPSYGQSPNHLVDFVVKSTTQTANSSQDRWFTQATAIKFTGITADAGATLTLPGARKYRVLVYGDSITEGTNVYGLPSGSIDTDNEDGTIDYAYNLGALLDAEVGVVGFGGSGLTVGGAGNAPQLSLSYNQLWNGQARSFAVQPDLVIYNEGANEAGRDPTSAVATVVNGIGTTTTTYSGLPGTRHLFLRPFAGQNAANIQAAVSAYNSPLVAYGDTSSITPIASADGLHPYGTWHLTFGTPYVAGLAMASLHPVASGTGGAVTLSASDEALIASIAGLQKSNTAVILPTLPPVTLAPSQAFNNTGQTSAPGWLGISSVLLPADHTAIQADMAGVPAATVAAMKTDSVLARTFSRAYQKYTYTISGHTMSLLKDDGSPLLGPDGVTPVTVTITSDTATGTITGKQ